MTFFVYGHWTSEKFLVRERDIVIVYMDINV